MNECKQCKILKLKVRIIKLKDKSDSLGYTWDDDEKHIRQLRSSRIRLRELQKGQN